MLVSNAQLPRLTTRLRGLEGFIGFAGIPGIDWNDIGSRYKWALDRAAPKYNQVQAFAASCDSVRGQPEAAGFLQAMDSDADHIYRIALHYADLSQHDTWSWWVPVYTKQRDLDLDSTNNEIIYNCDVFMGRYPGQLAQVNGAIGIRNERNRLAAIAAENARAEAQKAAEAAAAAEAARAQQAIREAEAKAAQAKVVTTYETAGVSAVQQGLVDAFTYADDARIGGIPVLPLILGAMTIGTGVYMISKMRAGRGAKSHSLSGYSRRRRTRRTRRTR